VGRCCLAHGVLSLLQLGLEVPPNVKRRFRAQAVRGSLTPVLHWKSGCGVGTPLFIRA